MIEGKISVARTENVFEYAITVKITKSGSEEDGGGAESRNRPPPSCSSSYYGDLQHRGPLSSSMVVRRSIWDMLALWSLLRTECNGAAIPLPPLSLEECDALQTLLPSSIAVVSGDAPISSVSAALLPSPTKLESWLTSLALGTRLGGRYTVSSPLLHPSENSLSSSNSIALFLFFDGPFFPPTSSEPPGPLLDASRSERTADTAIATGCGGDTSCEPARQKLLQHVSSFLNPSFADDVAGERRLVVASSQLATVKAPVFGYLNVPLLEAFRTTLPVVLPPYGGLVVAPPPSFSPSCGDDDKCLSQRLPLLLDLLANELLPVLKLRASHWKLFAASLYCLHAQSTRLEPGRGGGPRSVDNDTSVRRVEQSLYLMSRVLRQSYLPGLQSLFDSLSSLSDDVDALDAASTADTVTDYVSTNALKSEAEKSAMLYVKECWKGACRLAATCDEIGKVMEEQQQAEKLQKSAIATTSTSTTTTTTNIMTKSGGEMSGSSADSGSVSGIRSRHKTWTQAEEDDAWNGVISLITAAVADDLVAAAEAPGGGTGNNNTCCGASRASAPLRSAALNRLLAVPVSERWRRDNAAIAIFAAGGEDGALGPMTSGEDPTQEYEGCGVGGGGGGGGGRGGGQGDSVLSSYLMFENKTTTTTAEDRARGGGGGGYVSPPNDVKDFAAALMSGAHHCLSALQLLSDDVVVDGVMFEVSKLHSRLHSELRGGGNGGALGYGAIPPSSLSSCGREGMLAELKSLVTRNLSLGSALDAAANMKIVALELERALCSRRLRVAQLLEEKMVLLRDIAVEKKKPNNNNKGRLLVLKGELKNIEGVSISSVTNAKGMHVKAKKLSANIQSLASRIVEHQLGVFKGEATTTPTTTTTPSSGGERTTTRSNNSFGAVAILKRWAELEGSISTAAAVKTKKILRGGGGGGETSTGLETR